MSALNIKKFPDKSNEWCKCILLTQSHTVHFTKTQFYGSLDIYLSFCVCGIHS